MKLRQLLEHFVVFKIYVGYKIRFKEDPDNVRRVWGSATQGKAYYYLLVDQHGKKSRIARETLLSMQKEQEAEVFYP